VKIAYLYKGRPDLSVMIPDDVKERIMIDAGAGGVYADTDLRRLGEADGIIVSTEPITGDLLDACKKVKIIQRMGVGYDNVDLEAARQRGIPVCNLPGVNKEAVAEHGMMLILAVARGLAWNHNNTIQGKWERRMHWNNGALELAGKVMGIVGMGNTGFELAKRTRAHGMTIIYNDIAPIDPERVKAVDARLVEKDELFKTADVISINCDLNDQSRNMLDARRIEMLKPNAILVCCARGGMIDELALRDALNADKLFGAGLDVFDPEPIRPDNPMLSAKNVILTPHVAGGTREALQRAYVWAHENVRRAANDQQPKWIVNGVGG
jgi:phosphoglycerate dehydrogenase-like enzyme